MLGFFEMLEQTIVSLWNFVTVWISNLISGMIYMVEASAFIYEAIAFLPSPLLIPAGAVITIAVFHILTLSS